MADLTNSIIKNIYKFTKNRKGTKTLSKEKVGVMVCMPSITDPEKITFGFSLCHPIDTYDHIKTSSGGSSRQKNFGRELAMTRAIKWATIENTETIPLIPYKIRKEVETFIARAEKYYKDRTLAPWLEFVKTEILTSRHA